MKKHDVYGIGSPLMDLIVEVSPALIHELNLRKGETHLIDEEQFRIILDTIKYYDIRKVPGGSAANTIAGINNLGGSVIFCGKVGDDEHGNLYEQRLLEEGVSSNIRKADELTGHAITFITPDSERTFTTFLGAALNLRKEDIDEEELAGCKFLHIEGYLLEGRNKQAALYAIEVARKNNVKISIDLSDPALVRRNRDELESIVKGSYVIFANEEEAREFTGRRGEEALDELSRYCEVAVIKLGSKGSLIKHENRVYKIPGIKANAVDTTGAGDMYAACILYGLTHGLDLEKAGKLASFTAAKVVEQIGARLRDFETVKERLGLLKNERDC